MLKGFAFLRFLPSDMAGFARLSAALTTIGNLPRLRSEDL